MIPLPSKPKVVEKKDNKATFQIEGLYPGYGITIGNCLRRVLLSSLGGSAITQVKIKGVSHEFSTIPGVLEDVVMIILNLKKLRFQNFSSEPQTAILSVKGEKEVKAKDFKIPSQVNLSNPDADVATLTKPSAELNMEIQIEKGVGYEPIERRESEKSEVGVLPIDAIFTPVKRVKMAVENMRVGKRTDFDRLKIEVETDGTLSPEDAMTQAVDILVKHFSLLFEGLGGKEEKEETAAGAKKERKSAKERKEEEMKKMKIEELGLSERTRNVLENNNIKTVSGLKRKSKDSLLQLEGLGEKAVKEIEKALKKLGLELQ